MKSLPLKGTGKHKYSFQRVEALSFPKHFCDCEEHSDPSPPSKDQQICEPDLLGGAIDAKEFDLMKSVMNKLFEKEMGSEIGRDENNLTEGKVAEGTNFDEPQHEDSVEEDTGEDEDGLIINMVRSSGSIGTRMNKVENKLGYIRMSFAVFGLILIFSHVFCWRLYLCRCRYQSGKKQDLQLMKVVENRSRFRNVIIYLLKAVLDQPQVSMVQEVIYPLLILVGKINQKISPRLIQNGLRSPHGENFLVIRQRLRSLWNIYYQVLALLWK